jgi:UDP-N-acetylmuramyl pentapeptide synthase
LERIWLVGEEYEKAVSNSPTHQLINLSTFNSVDEVKAALKEEPIANFTILIKGSNSTKLHQLPEAFE